MLFTTNLPKLLMSHPIAHPSQEVEFVSPSDQSLAALGHATPFWR